MTVTPEEFNRRFQEKIRSLKTAEIVYPVATKVHDDMTRRVFNDGKKGDGSKIGTYSTEPMYASKKAFKKQGAFKGQGKNSKKQSFKNKKPRKSMYLQQGYKQLKQVQGYESGFVNLTYSADLRNDFASKLAIEGESVVLRLSREINKKKSEGLTEKYGSTLLKHTKSERDFFEKEVTKKVIQQLSS